MHKKKNEKRLTETIPGQLAAVLLAIIWIVSMAAVDSNAYSVWPFLVGIACVALLFLSGMLVGGKTIRLPWLGWFSLLCGGYFLLRSLCSYSTVEAWLESSLIVSCGVFYVAGIYGAQSKSGKFLLGTLVVAVTLNLLYLYLRPGETNMLWTGRPEYGLTGHNQLPTSLFVYKNFAGSFQMLGGAALLGGAMWLPLSRRIRLLCVLLGGASVGGAFFCLTRAVFLMGPILLVVLWLMQFIVEIFNRDKVRKLTVVCGCVLVVFICAELGNFFMGDGLKNIAYIDTHGRYVMWKKILNMAVIGPLWGSGTGASQWEIITQFNNSHTPNMAHNEYLQAWGDYGIIGVCAVILIIVLHSLKGFRLVAADYVSPGQRGLTCLALLALWGVSVVAFTDFYWHSYAFATMTAYCCGVLAAPVFGVSSKKYVSRDLSKLAARVQGGCSRAVMGLLALGVVGFACLRHADLSEAWLAQWEFSAMEEDGTDERYEKRLALLEQVMKTYPDSGIADCYFMLPHYGGVRPRSEEMLRRALAANPKQGYTLTMLVTVLGLEKRFEEAEILMRRYYPQEGLEVAKGCNWKFFYYYNLIRWSLDLIKQGKHEVGMSMAEYAINIQTPEVMLMSIKNRPEGTPWKKSRGGHSVEEVKAVSKEAQRKLKLLKRLGVQKDDSWMQPLEPGGKTALYPQVGIKPENSREDVKKGK